MAWCTNTQYCPVIIASTQAYVVANRTEEFLILFFTFFQPSSSHTPSSREKGPMGDTHYFVLRQAGGRIFVTSLHFTTKKPPCLHYHNLQQDIACTPTHPPSTSLIQFSVCISQACLASHKWTSGSVLTFQERGEVPRDEFYWQTKSLT